MGKKWSVLILTMLVTMPVVAVGVFTFTDAFRVRELPRLGEVPRFELVERSGARFTKEGLRGKVWAAGFIFTSCGGQCPLISAQMNKIQMKLRFKEAFRLVSITVDPDTDSPEVLARYATQWGADPYKWLFLTGEEDAINSLVVGGFHLATGETDGSAGTDDISHSQRLALVDGTGTIRGYYDALDEREVERLTEDAKTLLRKSF